MKRVTFMADQHVIERLRRAAVETGRPFGDIVREALEEKAAALAPRPKSPGQGDSKGRGPRAAVIGDMPVEPDSWRSS